MAMLDDIATYLAAQSTAFTINAGTSGGSLAKGIMLDATPSPDTLAVLYDTQGLDNSYSFSTTTGAVSVDYEQPSLQILSRSTSYVTARDRAVIASQILDGISKTLPTATGTRYLSITAAQVPFFIGRDDNERPTFSVNFNIQKDTT